MPWWGWMICIVASITMIMEDGGYGRWILAIILVLAFGALYELLQEILVAIRAHGVS